MVLCLPLESQQNPQQGHGAPSGVCTGPYADIDTGNFYVCRIGQYLLAGGVTSYLPGCNVIQTSCLGSATTAAIADWRQAATDGTCTNSSTAISWGTANEITTADIGKAIDIASGNVWLNNGVKTTILAVNQAAQTGTLSTAATSGGCGSGVTFFVYTDNAAAFNSSDVAASNAGAGTIVYYPCGDYGVASTIWSARAKQIAHVGGNAGRGTSSNANNCTRIHTSPAIWAAGTNALAPADTYEANISFTGNGMTITVANAGLIQWGFVTIIQNMQFSGYPGTLGGNETICVQLTDNQVAYSLSCQGDATGNMLGFSAHSLGLTLVDPQFSTMDLSDLANSSIIGGNMGKITSAGGGGSVNAPFIGTGLTNTITLTKPSVNTVDVHFVDVQINCQGVSNFALINIAAGAVGRFVNFKQENSSSSTGNICPGTPTIVNNGTLVSGGGNQFNNIGWSGTGTYFLSCTDFQTAPTISSGFGTSPSISSGVSPCSFQVNVGGGGTATSGVIGLPTAPHGWNCNAVNQTTNVAVRNSANSTTSCTLAVTTAWSANDIVSVQASPF